MFAKVLIDRLDGHVIANSLKMTRFILKFSLLQTKLGCPTVIGEASLDHAFKFGARPLFLIKIRVIMSDLKSPQSSTLKKYPNSPTVLKAL